MFWKLRLIVISACAHPGDGGTAAEYELESVRYHHYACEKTVV